jgi:UDP-3-O-[3-hydroxymyristoyl] N-acetylglucosamine deacetylase
MQKARRAMFLQRTLRSEILLSGIGLHSGKQIQLNIRPAKPNQGIHFCRVDLPHSKPISANFKNVMSTQLATTLGSGEAAISTVEHLMAAFYGLNIDNAIVELDGPEVPIMDGSSKVFYEALRAGGVELQFFPRPVLRLRRKIDLKMGEKWAVAEPSSRLEIHESIDWDHPAIGFQEFHYSEGKTSFEELSSARTFGFLKDFEHLKKMGLARGGSLDNALVLDQANVLNPGGLRYPDEFVRHKVLDALGDLKLAGVSIQASIRFHRAGHDLHRRLLMEIFSSPDHFEMYSGVSGQSERISENIHALLAGSVAANI